MTVQRSEDYDVLADFRISYLRRETLSVCALVPDCQVDRNNNMRSWGMHKSGVNYYSLFRAEFFVGGGGNLSRFAFRFFYSFFYSPPPPPPPGPFPVLSLCCLCIFKKKSTGGGGGGAGGGVFFFFLSALLFLSFFHVLGSY